ncbi:MAG: hypothetical protein F4W68_03700 [Cenarchaeum sp. SB0661_bin_35]|nr:hypothetical protein [Cenarchaeum sp. SB0661_bin_35]
MGRGYDADQVRHRLIRILDESEAGMSGVELASKMGMSRITLSKYLLYFEQHGVVHGKRIGNVTVWSIKSGFNDYSFPQDYFKVESAYMDMVLSGNAEDAIRLLERCVHSGAAPDKLILETIMQAFESIDRMYRTQKIGGLEMISFRDTLDRSLYALGDSQNIISTKNCITIETETIPDMSCRSVTAVLRSDGWHAYSLGDVSGVMDVFFDLELQKLLGRVWRGTPGVMILIVFGSNPDAFRFLADVFDTIRKKTSGNIRLAFCGDTGGKLLGSEMATTDVSNLIQWCDTIHQNMIKSLNS